MIRIFGPVFDAVAGVAASVEFDAAMRPVVARIAERVARPFVVGFGVGRGENGGRRGIFMKWEHLTPSPIF